MNPSDHANGAGRTGGGLFALNGLSIDQLSIDQDGELKVTFDLPVIQTTSRYHQQLQGVRTFDVYQDPELERLCRALFLAVRARVQGPDADREAVSCARCKTSDCCRKYNVLVTAGDVERLRSALGLPGKEFEERYLRPAVDWAGDYPHQLATDEDAHGEKCVFLREGTGGQMRCSIYEHRPQICRDFDEKTCDDFVPLSEVGVLSPAGTS